MISIFLGLSLVLINLSDAYVILQVQKQDENHSKVDAIIHKVVPSDKIQQFTQKIAKNKIHDVINLNTESSETENIDGGREELSLSVDDDPTLIKLMDLAIQQFTKPKGPVKRSNNHAKPPRKIKFRTGESSVLYEIKSQTFINGLKELLSSKLVRRYLDQLTRKAAVVYRSMKDSE